MSLIAEEHKEHIKSQLAENLINPVRLIMFTQELECQYCVQTKQLVYELAALNDKIQAEVHDFVADAELAKQYGVDKVPAIVLLGTKDYGIRFYGLPYGYEFQTLMSGLAIVLVGLDPQDLHRSSYSGTRRTLLVRGKKSLKFPGPIQ